MAARLAGGGGAEDGGALVAPVGRQRRFPLEQEFDHTGVAAFAREDERRAALRHEEPRELGAVEERVVGARRLPDGVNRRAHIEEQPAAPLVPAARRRVQRREARPTNAAAAAAAAAPAASAAARVGGLGVGAILE